METENGTSSGREAPKQFSNCGGAFFILLPRKGIRGSIPFSKSDAWKKTAAVRCDGRGAEP
jgi:hypothetical protein